MVRWLGQEVAQAVHSYYTLVWRQNTVRQVLTTSGIGAGGGESSRSLLISTRLVVTNQVNG